jgi:ankyrin repeat protein
MKGGFTPLLLAAGSGHAKCIALLLEAGADVHHTMEFDGVS